MIYVIIALLIIVFLALLFLFLIAPGRPDKAQKMIFFGRNIAHRGLHSADQSVPENSLAAFRAANAAGYGAELDVQLSRDGEVVVFHDYTLARACGEDVRVDSLDYSELKKYKLFGTDEHIPLFSEVLETLGGKEPLIVELKPVSDNKDLCKKTLDLLEKYNGDFCIESFDPFIVGWFRRNAPRVLRGQLSQPPRCYLVQTNIFVGIILGCTLFNFLARPQFIAYRIGKKPLLVRLAEKMGAMRVAWTGHDADCEVDYDTVIFEHHTPKVVYK